MIHWGSGGFFVFCLHFYLNAILWSPFQWKFLLVSVLYLSLKKPSTIPTYCSTHSMLQHWYCLVLILLNKCFLSVCVCHVLDIIHVRSGDGLPQDHWFCHSRMDQPRYGECKCRVGGRKPWREVRDCQWCPSKTCCVQGGWGTHYMLYPFAQFHLMLI